jgi:xylose isomerase
MMLEILAAGGFTTGGLNFDAKRRRESFEPVDLFHAHVAGMDAFARGLKAAAAIRADGRIAQFVRQRYASWDSELGRRIENGDASRCSGICIWHRRQSVPNGVELVDGDDFDL